MTNEREEKLLRILTRHKLEEGLIEDKNSEKGERKVKKREEYQHMSEEVYHRTRPVGSRPGVLYGLPKIHKENAPIRPIIAAVGTYNYK